MPQHHNWFHHIPLGNPRRRDLDRERKGSKGKKPLFGSPKLATYGDIDKHMYKETYAGDFRMRHYRLTDVASIYDMAPATIRRWYKTGMLPEFFGGGYIKQQVLVICRVLNDIFGQGVSQFRKSHTSHIEMMRAGNEMALRRFNIKLARGPKHLHASYHIRGNGREWRS